MPVREKAVQEFLTAALGDYPEPPKVGQRVLEYAAEGVYVRVMDSIDWKRVMHDASTRHMELHGGEYLSSTVVEEHAVGEVCSECLQEAMVANEWGGVKSWGTHPKGLRNRVGLRELRAPEVAFLIRHLAKRFIKPAVAPEGDREDDGHLFGCEEIGRAPDYRMICDPACQHYDGWIEEMAS